MFWLYRWHSHFDSNTFFPLQYTKFFDNFSSTQSQETSNKSCNKSRKTSPNHILPFCLFAFLFNNRCRIKRMLLELCLLLPAMSLGSWPTTSIPTSILFGNCKSRQWSIVSSYLTEGTLCLIMTIHANKHKICTSNSSFLFTPETLGIEYVSAYL